MPTASRGQAHMDDDTKQLGERPIKEETEEAIVHARWRALFNFTTRAHILPLSVGVLLSIASGIIIPALALFLGRVFDSFTDFGAGRISGSELIKKVSQNAIYIVALGSASWLLNGSYYMFWLIFGELQAKSVRDKLFSGMLQKDMEWYDTRKAGISAMIPRLQTQIRELQIATSQPLGFAVQYTVTMFAALGLALYTAWNLTLITLAGVPLAAFVLAGISARIQPAITAQIEELTQASKFANNSIAAIDTVKCFNGQDFEIWQYARAVKKAANHYLVQARTNAIQIGFVRFVILTMFVQGFWFGNHLVVTGQRNAGQVLTAFWACLMATQTVEQLLPQFIVLEKGRMASATLQAILIKMDKGRKVSSMIGQRTPQYCDGDIQVTNMSFAYPSRPDQFALKNASFFFPAGETTFVIGRSGSGKSTLSNLLLRFYNPAAGEVWIDGESIQTLDVNWLRNNITLVQQQSVLFNETIFKNIAFGRRNYERVKKEEIKKSLEMAALRDTVSELPKGLETLVGTGGSAMSGGQKQRVAIARARLRDTAILILDEATSALDHTSRLIVMDGIRKWRKGKTTIIITHDISQIEDNDYAYLLDGGRIVQEGYRHVLSKDESGLFASFLQPDAVFTKTSITPDESLDIQGPRISSDAHVSSDSLDSMDIQVKRRSRISTIYFPPENEYQPHRTSQAFISPLSPVVAHMSRITSPRASMLPVHNFPRLADLPEFTQLSSLVELETMEVPRIREGSHALEMKPLPPRPVMQDLSMKKKARQKVVQQKAISPFKTRKKHQLPPAEEVKPLIEILKTVWPRLTYGKRVVLVCGFAFAFIHAAATPVFSWVFSQLLSTFFQPDGSKQALKWSLSVLGVAVVDATASFFMHYLLEICGQAWVDALRVDAMKRVLDQPRSWFDRDKNNLSRLTECLDRNAEEMRNLVGRFAGFIFVAIVMMTVGIVWSSIVCWKLTLVVIATAPILYAVTRGFEAISGTWEAKSNNAAEAASAIFTDTFANIRTVRALTLEGYFHKKHQRATSSALNVGLRRATYSGIFFGTSDAGVIFVTALVFYYGSILAASYQFSTSNILIVFTMLLFSISSANAIIAFIPQINSSRDTATRLLRLASLPYKSSHEDTAETRKFSSGPIKFSSLTFTYPSRPTAKVLQGLRFDIPMNTSTALVGSSGSGKTTVAALLLGLYPCSSGALTIAGKCIGTLHIPTLRNMIILVPQQPTLFATTIAKNITYGLSEHSTLNATSNIYAATWRAGLHDFILSLPDGYNTRVGDGGMGLSGGQVQRLGIARALVRKPQVLIMDEPTSSLDAESAKGIRDCIKELVRARTTVLVITHSVEMMRGCENVVVMAAGKVVEHGTWVELMQRVGGDLRKLIGGEGMMG